MNYDTVILGEECKVTSNSQKTQRNNNQIVVGSPGSGKTMSISEARLLHTQNSSLVVTLSKRRLVKKYTPLFERRGYAVFDLNFTNPKESQLAYDPLQYVNNYSDIRFLAEAIVTANPKKKDNLSADPYWEDAAISLLSAEMALIIMTKSNASFSDVLDLNDRLEILEDSGLIVTSLDEKYERIKRKDPNAYAVSCWKTFKNLPIKTASCVLSTLNSTLDTIFSPDLREMMRKVKKVDFEKLGIEKTILFVSSSAVNPAIHSFINLFYANMFKELFEFAEKQPDGALKIPVHCVCDDFAVGSRIANFSEYISIFREKNISATLLLQSESQLESIYGQADAKTIMNGCDTYIYMGSNDIQSARNIAERCNKSLQDILYMPIGTEIILQRQCFPVFTKRYDILRDDLYQEITRQYQETIKREEALISEEK